MNYDKFKRVLNEEKNSIKGRLKSGKEDLSNHNELSYYDNHPADSATELFQMEKELILNSRDEVTLKKIDHALNKINNGSYGRCENCGAIIPLERLEAIPYTTICSKCQEKDYEYTTHKSNFGTSSLYSSEFDMVTEFNGRENIYEEGNIGENKFRGNINNIDKLS